MPSPKDKSETIRVVIRQPLHPLLKKLARQMNTDDYGEVVNYLLIELQKINYNFCDCNLSQSKASESNNSNLSSQIAGMLS